MPDNALRWSIVAVCSAATVCLVGLLLLLWSRQPTGGPPPNSELAAILDEFEASEHGRGSEKVAADEPEPPSDGAIRLRSAGAADLAAAGLRTSALVVEGHGAGLVTGDLMAFIDDQPPRSAASVVERVRQLGHGEASLLIYRQGIPRRITVSSPDLVAAIDRGQNSGEQTLDSASRPSLGGDQGGTHPIGAEPQWADENELVVLTEAIADAELDDQTDSWDNEPSEEQTEEALRELIALLQHPEAVERARAAMDIATYGSAAVVAIPALVRASRDSESTVRLAACIGIGGIGAEPETSETVPALLRLLRDPSPAVRIEAARAFADVWLSPEQLDRVGTALEAALADSDDRVRNAAADSLDILGF